MALHGARNIVQNEFELILRHSNPAKLKLLRANPYTCPGPPTALCFANGRQSLSFQCPICAGSGYVGVTRNAVTGLLMYGGNPYDDTNLPASTVYYIYADLQTGHGLYGSGGDFIKLLTDLGRQDVGDGTLFTLMFDVDRQTGAEIYPIVDPTLTRPDRIISRYGTIYNIVRQMIIEDGTTAICRSFTIEAGVFTSTGASGR